MQLIIYFIVVILIYSKQNFVNATFCKPLSTFKIDCNICKCTSNGQQYTCTENPCQPREYDNFIKEQTEDGYLILKPKPRQNFDFDDDFVLTKRLRRQHLPDFNDISDNNNWVDESIGDTKLEDHSLESVEDDDDAISNLNYLIR